MPFYQVTSLYPGGDGAADVKYLYSLSPRKVLKYLSLLDPDYPSYDDIEKMNDDVIEERFLDNVLCEWKEGIAFNIQEIDTIEVINTENFLKSKCSLTVPSKPIETSIWKTFMKPDITEQENLPEDNNKVGNEPTKTKESRGWFGSWNDINIFK